MPNPNEPGRDYLGEDFTRLAVTLAIVAIAVICISIAERKYSVFSRLIILPQNAPAAESPLPSPK